MIWYLLLLFTVVIIAYFSQEEELLLNDTGCVYYGRGISTIGFMTIVLILIAFEGFRSSTVGTDTGGYCRGYMAHTSMWWRLDITDIYVLLKEPGLRIISIIADLFSNNYISFLTVSATVMVGSALTAIRKSTIQFDKSLFAYITLAFYLFGFAGIRQGLALNIFLWGYIFIFNSDFKRYVLVVLVAALFHKSVIVALPIYLFTRLEYSTKNLLYIAVGAIVIGLSMSTLLEYGSTLEDRYEYYTQTTKAGSGMLLALFSLCLTIFYIIKRYLIPADRLYLYDKSLIMLVVGTSIYLIVTLTGSNTELNRFALYFQLGAVFLFAEYANEARNSKAENEMFYLLSVVHIIYYIAYINQIGGITDYKLNPVLWS